MKIDTVQVIIRFGIKNLRSYNGGIIEGMDDYIISIDQQLMCPI
jgi:hypothetical protein